LEGIIQSWSMLTSVPSGTYHAYVNTSDGTIETGNTWAGNPCNAQSGWKYDATTSALPSQGTTDPAGLPLLPLIWRGHEILAGC